MLIVLSPAKTLDFQTKDKVNTYTLPRLTDESVKLIEVCRKLSPVAISELMKVSDKIASLNAVRFAQWSVDHNLTNSKAAVLAFKGDVYTGLQAENCSEDELNWAQDHLRILSGLYGLLKPLDLMQPYRLEMGSKLSNSKGANLYQFWGDIITNELNQAIENQGDDKLINLASNEYFKSVNLKKLNAQVITPVFKDLKNGQYKIISFYAKKARGLMARYIIDNKLTDINKLTEFDYAGYYYCEAESNAKEWVFKRDQA